MNEEKIILRFYRRISSEVSFPISYEAAVRFFLRANQEVRIVTWQYSASVRLLEQTSYAIECEKLRVIASDLSVLLLLPIEVVGSRE